MTTNPSLKIIPIGEREIHITRVFNAPSHILFEAYANQDNQKNWLGKVRGTVIESYGKPEIGVPWSFKFEMPGYGIHQLFGQCLEAICNTKYVRTVTYNVPGVRESPYVEIATFTEENGETTLHIIARHFCQENRDNHLNSCLEQSFESGFNALDTYIQEIQSQEQNND